MTITNYRIKMTKLQIPFPEPRNDKIKEPIFPSSQPCIVFIIVAPDILHRRMQIQMRRHSRNRRNVFRNGKRRNLNLIRLSSFNLERKELHKPRIKHHQITIIKNTGQDLHFPLSKKKKNLIDPFW